MRSVGHRGMTYATSARLCKKIPPQHVCLLVFLEGGLLARRRLTPGVPPSGAGGVVDSVLAAPLRVAGSSSLEGSSPQSSPVPRGESGRFGSGGGLVGATASYPWGTPLRRGGRGRLRVGCVPEDRWVEFPRGELTPIFPGSLEGIRVVLVPGGGSPLGRVSLRLSSRGGEVRRLRGTRLVSGLEPAIHSEWVGLW